MKITIGMTLGVAAWIYLFSASAPFMAEIAIAGIIGITGGVATFTVLALAIAWLVDRISIR